MIVKSVSEFFPDLKTEKPVPYNPSKHKKDKVCIVWIQTNIKHSGLGWNSEEGLWMGAGEGSGRLRFLIATSGFKVRLSW